MERSEGLSESRNSGVRKVLKFIPEAGAKIVHKLVPDLTPNQVTAASALATTIVAVMAERRNTIGKGSSKVELAVLAIAQGLDFFDGSLAREIKRVGDREHDSKWGGMWDSTNDRWGAGVMGISRIISAHLRSDRFGETVATITTLTNPLPALLRAVGERRGEVFPESGANSLEFFGTHAGRTILAIPATLFPSFYRLQNTADTISAVANTVVTFKRFQGGIPLELPEERDALSEDANFRGKALIYATIATGAVVLATHIFLHRKK